MANKTRLSIRRALKQWIDPQTRMIKVDPDVLAAWIDNLLSMEQSPLKPFAVTEQGHIYVWNPTTETWNRAQMTDIYRAVRRDPAV